MLRKLDRYWENINVPTLPQTVGKWKKCDLPTIFKSNFD